MFKSTVWAISIIVMTSVPLGANDAPKDTNKPPALDCPIVKEAELKNLADKGEIDLNGKSFRLVSGEEISNDYHKRLIGSQSDLAGFLNKSSSTLTITRYINSHQNAMIKNPLKKHCPYILQRGSEIVVIAIALDS